MNVGSCRTPRAASGSPISRPVSELACSCQPPVAARRRSRGWSLRYCPATRREAAEVYAKTLITVAAAVAAVCASACTSVASAQNAQLTTAASASSSPAAAPSLRVLTEPKAGIGPIYQLITGARSSVDLTMYELADPTAEADLAADAARGVDVRVILDQYLEKSANTARLRLPEPRTACTSGGGRPAPRYHQKTLTVDDATSVIMTLNLVADGLPGHPGLRRDRHQPRRRRRHRHHLQRRLRRPAHHPARRHRPGVVTDQRPGIGPVGHQWGDPHPGRGERGDGRPGRHRRPGSRGAARRGRQDHHDRGPRMGPGLQPSWPMPACISGSTPTTAAPCTSTPRRSSPTPACAGQQVLVGSQNFSVASLDYNRELGILHPQPGRRWPPSAQRPGQRLRRRQPYTPPPVPGRGSGAWCTATASVYNAATTRTTSTCTPTSRTRQRPRPPTATRTPMRPTAPVTR